MTVEEIKNQMSMADVVTKYGYKISRAGFISCPFHKGDRTASMKIYKDSYHCFGCGTSGDIFSFVQNHDNCDFKTAFYSLGGKYQERNIKRDIALYKLKKARQKAESRTEKLKKELKLRQFFLSCLQKGIRLAEPMSDAWCYLINEFETELYKVNALEEELERR